MIEKLLSIFEADLEYLRSLGDTSKQNTEYGVRLRTLEVLGGDVTKKPTLLVDVEKRILELLGGENSDYKSIYVIRKEIADKMGIDTSNLKTVYEIALACLNASPIEVEYTVTFKNYDGTILSTQKVLSGEIPVYEGSTPVRESDGEYNYTFNGWLPELGPVTGNVEYVAQYTATEIPVGPDLTLPYVTFTAEEAGSTLGLSQLSTNQTLEYSNDTTTWNTFDTTTTVTLANVGDKVYVRGILSANNSSSNYTQFKMTGKIAASGNCNAIWNYQDIEAQLKQYCGRRMFRDCKSLTTAPELPVTTLAIDCYNQMFQGCTSLTTAPELPATTLVFDGYYAMFSGCTSLTTAPELPATTLAGYCYSYMFSGCTSLTTAPELPATTLIEGCYRHMFNGCTSLTEAPELPATTLATQCYSYMFNGCSSLTTAPELPATTLAQSCYSYMFERCSKLNKITCLATDISASYCTGSWLKSVSSTGTFIKDPNMTSWTTGSDGIPSGWTVEDYAG